MVLSILIAVTLAKPWQGIEPGLSTRDQVVTKFGEPTKVVKAGGVEVLAYQKEKVIKGTKQAQFKVNPSTDTVVRIDVFPAVDLLLPDIEKAYGPECKTPETKEKPCYLKRIEPARMYVVYSKLGLAVFFGDDGKVTSLTFLPEKP
jgi:hypothetical protein